jgi:hypothetical protein
MIGSILEKLDFSGPNLGMQPLAFTIFLYFIIIACTYHSINSLGIMTRIKILWFVLVTVFPVIGLLIYLGYCGWQNLKMHPILGRFLNPSLPKTMPTKTPPPAFLN